MIALKKNCSIKIIVLQKDLNLKRWLVMKMLKIIGIVTLSNKVYMYEMFGNKFNFRRCCAPLLSCLYSCNQSQLVLCGYFQRPGSSAGHADEKSGFTRSCQRPASNSCLFRGRRTGSFRQICAFVQHCWPQLFVRGWRLSVGPWGGVLAQQLGENETLGIEFEPAGKRPHEQWCAWWEVTAFNTESFPCRRGKIFAIKHHHENYPKQDVDDITCAMSTQLFGREKGWGDVL